MSDRPDAGGPTPMSEADAVRERYARRRDDDPRYRLTQDAALLAWQERQRAIVSMLRRHGHDDLSRPTLLEVGSGGGGNLVEALMLGFTPAHLRGIELLAERHAAARARLPDAVRLTCADATALPLGPLDGEPADIVFQSTVFSSLLDDAAQRALAQRMWAWTKPGGAVLWYDFAVGNPRNRDVRGVPLARVRALFPQAAIEARRITLAPPLARAVAPLHPALYTALSALQPLRTHRLAWLSKPMTHR